MRRLPAVAVGVVVVVVTAFVPGCTDDSADAPRFDTLQSQLAQVGVAFNRETPGVRRRQR
jgi:hypothetical protein